MRDFFAMTTILPRSVRADFVLTFANGGQSELRLILDLLLPARSSEGHLGADRNRVTHEFALTRRFESRISGEHGVANVALYRTELHPE